MRVNNLFGLGSFLVKTDSKLIKIDMNGLEKMSDLFWVWYRQISLYMAHGGIL